MRMNTQVASAAVLKPARTRARRNAAPESSMLADIGDMAQAAGDAALEATKEVFVHLLDEL
jgi:hypothetical protein